MKNKLIFCSILIVTSLHAENFVIKKVKKVVVNTKDQCLDAMGRLVKKIPKTISCLSDRQLHMMQELEKELNAKQNVLTSKSEAQLKKYRDAIAMVEQKLDELEHACKKFHALK